MPEKREKRNIARTEIINYMLNHSVTSKAELAKELGLSMPTVLTNVNELIAKGLIVENGEYASTGGTQPGCTRPIQPDIPDVNTS